MSTVVPCQIWDIVACEIMEFSIVAVCNLARSPSIYRVAEEDHSFSKLSPFNSKRRNIFGNI